jgi:hypothetical protein
VSDDTDALFSAGAKALGERRANDAIASFEALADRGVFDASMSYDRGLAYAERVRIGAEQPGDLGRAAQGFEEARALTQDAKLAGDATQALAVVRAEVARRKARAGDPVELDQGMPLGRAFSHLAAEDTWAALAIAASVVLGIALFVRWLVVAHRARIGASIAVAIALPALVLFAALAAQLRDERLYRREAVVISAAARPTDERGVTIPNAQPIPEAALVEIVDTKPGFARVRRGATEAWISSSSIRVIAKAE